MVHGVQRTDIWIAMSLPALSSDETKSITLHLYYCDLKEEIFSKIVQVHCTYDKFFSLSI